jgi:phosphoribosylformylglycinamidine synthase
MIQIKVIQYLKNDIKDPEGGEVRKALVRLGYPVERVGVGREIVLLVDEMCQRLLVNPILHEYSVDVVTEEFI